MSAAGGGVDFRYLAVDVAQPLCLIIVLKVFVEISTFTFLSETRPLIELLFEFSDLTLSRFF